MLLTVSYRQHILGIAWIVIGRELHREYPWVQIWDDHEFANDTVALILPYHNREHKGSWAVRKGICHSIFTKEWFPMRRYLVQTVLTGSKS